MEFPPGIAAQVLSDDLRNIVQKVADGGILSGPERELMRQFALTRDSASQERVGSLLAKWRAGARLTSAEIDEIRLHDFTFSPDPQPIALPAAPTTTPESSDETPPPSPDPGFIFGQDPRPSRVTLTGEQLHRWGALYGTQRRQLRRWHNLGIEHSDPCPFDHPAQMPTWWRRRMSQRCPAKILLAAAADSAVATAPASVTSESAPREGIDGQPSAKKPKSEEDGAQKNPGFSIDGTGVVEGEAVQQARQIVASAFGQLRAAAKDGDVNGVQLWQVRWEKSVETLRRQERDDREWQEQRKLLLPRAQLLTELAQLFEALRLMGSGMTDKIIAELYKRAGHRRRRILRLLEPELRAAIAIVRSRETDLMHSIESLDSTDAASSAFTLAA